MKPALVGRLEVAVWAFVYGGLLVAGLGIALHRGGADWGAGVVVAGALLVVAGAVLIVIRSRMGDAAGVDSPTE